MAILSSINKIVETLLGFRLIRSASFKQFSSLPRFAFFWDSLTFDQKVIVSPYLVHSKSQNFQDVAVIALLKGKRNGYFVEVGAGDGVCMSNTFLLEQFFDWNGLLIEPAESYYPGILTARKAHVANEFIGPVSGSHFEFLEITNPAGKFTREFSTAESRRMRRFRKTSGLNYETKIKTSRTLEDLFVQRGLPHHIDFISLDVEGMEYSILSTFPFHDYSFSIVCVEHNYGKSRELIRDLLSERGYSLILEDLFLQDDFYVSKKVLEQAISS